jgi:hypothetical protein
MDQMALKNRMGMRRRLLFMVGALLIVGGLALTLSAPKSPLVNNKADAYGAPVPTKPTNPKTKAECTNYFGTTNQDTEARECLAIASRNAAFKRCNKKHGAAKKTCRANATKAYNRTRAKLAVQKKAEAVCQSAYSTASNLLNTEDPEYVTKLQQLSATQVSCLTKAHG